MSDSAEFDHIREYLEEAFNALSQRLGAKRSDNPEQYPRKVKIDDDDVLLLVTRFQELHRRWRNLSRDLHDLFHEAALTKSRVTRAIEAAYPEITEHEKGGKHHFASWRGDWWVMGWGGSHEGEEKSV